MELNKNDTFRNFKNSKRIDINKIMVKYNNTDDYNHNKYFTLKKVKDIILFLIIIILLVGLILFLILFFTDKKTKKSFSFTQNNNYTNLDGYYIPKDRLLNPYYIKCSIENCKKCYGTTYNNTCISCLNSYKPILDENNKIISCELIELIPPKEEDVNITSEVNEKIFATDIISKKVTSQDIIPEFSTELITNKITDENLIIECEPGYYLPKGESQCKECSIFGCKKCHGDNINNYCDLCFSRYVLKQIDNDNLSCIECESNCIECDQITLRCLKCDNEYVLYEGKCYAYSFSSIYFTSEDNKNITLYLEGKYIEKIIIDDTIYKPNNKDFPINVNIQFKGNHTAFFFLQNNPASFEYLFYDNEYIISINFTSNFNYENITSLCWMFSGCISLTSIEFSNFNTFNTSNVKDMSYMFYECAKLSSLNLSSFNTSNVINMEGMFYFCVSLNNLDINNFNFQNVMNVACMFYYCISLTSLILPYNNRDNKIIYMAYMFAYCSKLTSLNLFGLLSFSVSNVIYMVSMFQGCSSLIEFNLVDPVKSYLKFVGNTNYYYPFTLNKLEDINNMFSNCISLKVVKFPDLNLENLVSMSEMFKNCTSLETIVFGDIYIPNIKYMDSLFSGCSSLKEIDLTSFKGISNLVYMSYMFENCSSIKEIDISSFNLTNVVYIEFMFSGCSSLTQVNFNNKSKNIIKYMNSLFEGCYSLTSVNFNNFYTENVYNMSRMFYNCSSISYLNLNSFNTTNVKYMDEMFFGCLSIKELYISNFDGTSLISYENMIKNMNKNSTIYTNKEFYLNILSKLNFSS